MMTMILVNLAILRYLPVFFFSLSLICAAFSLLWPLTFWQCYLCQMWAFAVMKLCSLNVNAIFSQQYNFRTRKIYQPTTIGLKAVLCEMHMAHTDTVMAIYFRNIAPPYLWMHKAQQKSLLKIRIRWWCTQEDLSNKFCWTVNCPKHYCDNQ